MREAPMGKVFNWEGYSNNYQSHKFSEMTEDELKEWSKNWGFKIKKENDKIWVVGRYGCKIRQK